MKHVVFFNNKGGVGKTSLIYHLAWMFNDHGLRVIAADLDPQANLTSMFLQEERLEKLWPETQHSDTIFGAIQPILRGLGDIKIPPIVEIVPGLGLVVGDLNLSRFEDKLSEAWPRCHNRDESAFRTMSAFYRVVQQAGIAMQADIALIDVGPNLGAINRSAVIAADAVVVPLAPDLFSVQGLKNLGPTLVAWRSTWQELRARNPAADLSLPAGTMAPLGYIVMQHAMRLNRPVKAYQRWIDRFPRVFREEMLPNATSEIPAIADDPLCLATLQHFRSLMPMAMEARKPMFFLKPADGAIGAHTAAVRNCYRQFLELARAVALGIGIPESAFCTRY